MAPNLELLFPKYFSGTYGISVQFFFIDPFFSNGLCCSLYLMLTIRIICSTYFYCVVQCFSILKLDHKQIEIGILLCSLHITYDIFGHSHLNAGFLSLHNSIASVKTDLYFVFFQELAVLP